MNIDLILFIAAAVVFGVDAWLKRSLVSAGFCLLTLALFVV
jgi:hypothetical protein